MAKAIKWVLVVIALFLLSFGILHLFKKPKKSSVSPAQDSIRVIAQYVCPESLPLSVKAAGKVVAQQQTVLQPKVPGYITHILFHEGQLVHAGQALVLLDDRIQLADVQQKQINLQQTHQTYKRNLMASHSGGISKQALDKTWTDYQNAQNALRQAKITLQNMIIRAPFQGVAGQNKLSVGEYVTPQTSLLQMVDRHNLRVTYHLASQYLDKAKVGQKVHVINGAKTYSGRVSFVDTAVDPETQTFSVTAVLDKVKSGLLPGLFVSVEQQLGAAANTLMLPGLSVQTQIGSYYVYGVQNNKAQQIAVTLGPRVGDRVAIISGLRPGQLIITQGADQLHPQSSVIVSKIENKECS